MSSEPQLLRLSSSEPEFDRRLEALIRQANAVDREAEDVAAKIIDTVQTRGDAALVELSAELDNLQLDRAALLELPRSKLDEALNSLPFKQRQPMELAASRIRDYHLKMRDERGPAVWSYRDDAGFSLGSMQTPLQRVGVYAPGGSAAYSSTVLMTAIPAKVAGVEDIVLTTPPHDGTVNLGVLAAAALAGVSRVFMLGGAQAIAALAFGTATVPRVDKIVGPGNRYVNAAKRLVHGRVGIDLLAGPSEILIITDGNSCEVDWVVMDLFSQAEHDTDSRAILLCPSAEFLDRVAQRVPSLLPDLPRRDIIAKALNKHGALVQVDSLQQAMEISNRIAPEHLSLLVEDPHQLTSQPIRAGAVFLGTEVAQVLGDYCAGPSHVLPTAGTARFSSGLHIGDFLRNTSLIGGAPHAAGIYHTAAAMARMEGLEAHARSAEYRLRK